MKTNKTSSLFAIHRKDLGNTVTKTIPKRGTFQFVCPSLVSHCWCISWIYQFNHQFSIAPVNLPARCSDNVGSGDTTSDSCTAHAFRLNPNRMWICVFLPQRCVRWVCADVAKPSGSGSIAVGLARWNEDGFTLFLFDDELILRKPRRTSPPSSPPKCWLDRGRAQHSSPRCLYTRKQKSTGNDCEQV